ncbi:MAG: arginase, partial [Clostridia bacterium]|nr:arginase [Clostridia bacterium]
PTEEVRTSAGIGENNMKYRHSVMTFCRRLAGSVTEAIEAGTLPLVIGGDHSLAIGSIAGCAAVYGADDLSVVYVDGHTDINTPESTETGMIHGMPLASAMGLCGEKLTVGDRVNLHGKNTFIIGARSIDRGEYPIIEEQGVNLYTADGVRRIGLENAVDDLIGRISTSRIHLSFDVDFIDGSDFFATGYVMPDGLSADDAVYIVRRIAETGKVCSADFVEYNPSRDKNDECAKKLLSVISAFTRAAEVG